MTADTDRGVVADLSEALSVMARAFRMAEEELALIAVTPMPLSDRIEKALVDYEAMKATLARASTERRLKGYLAEVFREEKQRLAGSRLTNESCPVMQEVTASVGEARESLRRLYGLSPAVRGALDDVPGGWQ